MALSTTTPFTVNHAPDFHGVNALLDGTLAVDGATELDGAVTCNDTLAVTGAVTLAGKALSGTPIVSNEVTFVETTGAGTYTGAVVIPAGATLLDIIIEGTALWTAATSASLEVGDADDADGYFTAVDLKATDLLADETINFDRTGGQEGPYLAGTATHWTNRYQATARTITGTIVTVGATGNAGRTRMTVIYSQPSSTYIAAATKA